MKKIVNIINFFVFCFSFLFFSGFVLNLASPNVALATDKIDICHATSSESNPWNAISIDSSALQAHLDDHGDFLYTGPSDGDKDQWCIDNQPINGGWTEWTPINSEECGQVVEQTRSCTNPTPMHGGADCEGPNTQTITNPACPPPVETQQCDVISDTTNIIEDGSTPATETWVHPNWVQSIVDSLAKWIWNSEYVLDPTVDETETFTKTFTVGGPIDSADIKIAADNGYKLEINGNLVVDKLTTEYNFITIQGPTDVKSYLVDGTNTIKFTVMNFGRQGNTSTQNPAGLLYSLSIVSATCSSESVPEEPPIDQCVDETIDGSWADSVIDFNQAKRKDGSNVLPARSNSADVLGPSNWTAGGSTGFISLGFGGSITVAFDSFVPNVDGADISIHEATNGTYPLEQANVEVSQDGTNWELAGVADNIPTSKISYIDFSSTSFSWIKYVRVTDTSTPSLFSNDGDGFDLDAIDVTQQVCDEPKEEPKFSTVTMCKIDTDQNPLSGWTLMLKGENIQTGLSVPANLSSGVNSSDLLSGVSYIAKAVGTWLNQGGANPVDAEYSTTDAWANQMDGYTGYQNDILELQINNQFDPISNWGAYNSAHTYAQSFIPSTTGPANFRIFDGTGTTQNEGWFGDNSGSLSVDINKGYSGITGGDGCTTFTEVPYGTYTTDEIMKDGWENVSGLGEVTVNDPTESFTIINQIIPEELLPEQELCTDELANNTGEVLPCTYNQNEVVDMCPNIEGIQESIPEGKELDDSKNCIDTIIPTVTRRGSSGGFIGGRVLGASTGEVLGDSTTCGIYIEKYMRKGYKNNVDAVKKLQKFLNDYLQSGLKVDGIFGTETENAVKQFQAKHSDKVLLPWKLKGPTGIFYITTQTEVNNIMCPDLKLPTPALIPLSNHIFS
jgi:hypothetical protein